MSLVVVVVGAGSGSRYGGDKLAERLGSETVLERSIRALSEACPTAPTVAVLSGARLAHWQPFLETRRPGVVLVEGGDRRQDSVRLGVAAAAGRGAEVVVIHDAARPLVHPADVVATVAAIEDAEASILCGRVVDTVKRVDPGGRVVETLDRDRLRLAQTPQVFRIRALERAWEACDWHRLWTDEASMLEALGLRVRTVLARFPNPKITTPADLLVARALLAEG